MAAKVTKNLIFGNWLSKWRDSTISRNNPTLFAAGGIASLLN
jgi:hypothetical protein